MKTLAILFGGVVIGGLALGWALANVPTPAPSGSRSIAQAVVVRHAGQDAAAVRPRFQALHPPPPPPVVEQPQAPPPPDVAIVFRRLLTAVEHNPPSVLVVDYNADGARRRIRQGQVFQDGWRLVRIGEQEIVLRRRRETRTIQIFDPPESSETAGQ